MAKPKSPREKRIPFNTTLNKEHAEKIHELSMTRMIRPSQVIRQIVAEYIEREQLIDASKSI